MTANEPRRFGRYEVTRVIGRGAMGLVYLAEDPLIARQVAIKIIKVHSESTEQEFAELKDRFQKEFRTAGMLSHPNIVTVYDVGQEGDNAFIAMEYVDGESLQQALRGGRELRVEEAVGVAAQVGSALYYAHRRGVVHRDIKPANIMITSDGQCKLADFGVAKLTETTLTQQGRIIGSPAYMSPEQVEGHAVTPASDQFSLAVVLYELLAGHRPFRGDSPPAIMYQILHADPASLMVETPGLPPALGQVVMKGLSKSPDNRYANCSKFSHAMRVATGVTGSDTPLDGSTLPTVGSEADWDVGALDESATVIVPAKRRWRQVLTITVGLLVDAAILGVAVWWIQVPLVTGGAAVVSEGEPVMALFGEIIQITSDPAGLAIWRDGVDLERVTPSTIDVSGEIDQTVQLQLRQGQSVLAETMLILGPDIEREWRPEIIAPSVRYLVTSVPARAQVFAN